MGLGFDGRSVALVIYRLCTTGFPRVFPNTEIDRVFRRTQSRYGSTGQLRSFHEVLPLRSTAISASGLPKMLVGVASKGGTILEHGSPKQQVVLAKLSTLEQETQPASQILTSVLCHALAVG